MKEKSSYGICSIRKNNGKFEILLVQKRLTYGYTKFVNGNYNLNNLIEMREMFNQMTVDEKLIILTMDFDNIWEHAWHNNNNVKKNDNKIKFMKMNVDLLKELIEKSDNSDRVWEFPKGQKYRFAEKALDCATREFFEETGIQKNNYLLIPDIIINDNYEDDNIKYKLSFYVSLIVENINVKIIPGSLQSYEICNIAWRSLEQIKQIESSPRLYKLSRIAINYIKKNNSKFIPDI